MKSITTEIRGKMPEEEFIAAMTAMGYFIDSVDKYINLPFSDKQYVEWEVCGDYDEGQWRVIGRPKYFHDIRFQDQGRRIREIKNHVGNVNLTYAVSYNQTHQICRVVPVDLHYFYQKELVEVLFKEFAKSININARLVK